MARLPDWEGAFDLAGSGIAPGKGVVSFSMFGLFNCAWMFTILIVDI